MILCLYENCCLLSLNLPFYSPVSLINCFLFSISILCMLIFPKMSFWFSSLYLMARQEPTYKTVKPSFLGWAQNSTVIGMTCRWLCTYHPALTSVRLSYILVNDIDIHLVCYVRKPRTFLLFMCAPVNTSLQPTRTPSGLLHPLIVSP